MHWRQRTRRRPAINEPAHAHELTFSCYRRFPFLRAERTCQWLAESLHEARQRYDLALWAYVFMPDHVHLIVWPRQPGYDIRAILAAIKEPVGRRAVRHLRREAPEWLPRISAQRGRRTERHFWQPGGGYDRNITEETTLLAMIEYAHHNPVRKGLVRAARDWRWSSAAWYEGAGPTPLAPDPIPPGWFVK